MPNTSVDQEQHLQFKWSIPLPSEQYLNYRIVIYFFSDGLWIPIKYCHLSKAIEIYHTGVFEAAKELLVFPVDLDPNIF
ncbi:hypothetical protein [Anabaena sp. UHCC 0399]|uniref:hypothetical protein n=1 Tax=Anabaena sp. UHCC 0399 TaxID=3110238 RepID=UPI002B21664F|nr:hypothetical protein [Anabaena sp. UHCC 0399]MEA5565504.1 hypothetical protein [Anabaena sp. UHCC 0399]